MANNVAEMIKLCQEMPLMHERLHRAGLHKTAQKFKAALDEIGFEVEDKITKEQTSA